MSEHRPTCSTCRFFGVRMGIDAWDDDYVTSFGSGGMRETEHHACARIIHGNDGRPFPAIKDEPAIVTDRSGYAARLRVLPTFGCALHEERHG